MEVKFLQMKRALRSVLLVLLLGVVGMTNVNAQTPYRQYADNGVLLNFHEIDNVDFRVFLLYNLSQDDQFILIANEEFGQFSVVSNNEEETTGLFDAFESFYQNAYTDFSLLSKTDIDGRMSVWKSQVAPQQFTSIMMDVTLRRSRSGENETCINADPFCTSDFYEFESATTSQTADDLEPYPIEDGCIGSSYNPSWYYLRIADSGPLIIHMEGYDPDNPTTKRDIDFCLWGPFTEEQMNSGYACSHLTTNMIIDCNYSASYIENAYMGYQEGQHQHNTGHGTVNYHVPQSGEYYLLMITNFSRQPCVITFNKPEDSGPGTTDCSILPPIVDNSGPYCVGETIYLSAIGQPGAVYSWTGPGNFRSRYQNPIRPNCTMAMAGLYICTISKSGYTGTACDTTWVEVYPNVNADFTATNVDVGHATQFNSTSTTNPTGYSISSYEWDFGDGQTASGATPSHTYANAGTYPVTLTVSTGHCIDEITQNVTVNIIPTAIINFADANVKALCVANWDTNGDGELSYAEAAAVTDLGRVFKSNRNITTFDELQYFTGLTSIGSEAFRWCENLTSISIPNSVSLIGSYAFWYCRSLTLIEIPNSVSIFESYAFYLCDGLTQLEIPNTVTSIKYAAFSHCRGLSSIEIPNSVTLIEPEAFAFCSGLEQIIVDSGNLYYDSRENCNAIIRTSNNSLVTGCKNTIIPNSVTSLGPYAFRGCSGLISVEIPNTITSFGNNPFSYCDGLEQIIVASGNLYYDSRDNCNAIIKTSTNELVIGCKSTVIPNSVTSIGNQAFEGCSVLTTMAIPNSVTTIKNFAFNYSGVTSMEIPNSVTTISVGVFQGCSNLSSIILPNTITSIPNWLFSACTSLTSIIIPSSIISIGEHAFYTCTRLTSIEIPELVASIGTNAFSYCVDLSSMTVLAETPPILDDGVFEGVDKAIPVYVPCGTVEAYQSATGWSEFTNFVSIATENEVYYETACDSYFWHNTEYTQSGTYTYTTTTSQGCILETLHLTINQSEEEEVTITDCDTYTWTEGNGETYTTGGDYTWNTTTDDGCPKTVTLHLTINYSEDEDYTVTECDSYTWTDGNGQTYTTSGDYVWNTTTAQGCPKTVTLHLTINQSDEINLDPVTACDYWYWNGHHITQSGSFDCETTTSEGCTRIEHLYVTINYSDEVNLDPVTECDSYTWNGQTITQSGTYDHLTTTPEGCDRIEHLTVTINQSEEEEFTVIENNSYTWHGQTYTQSGTYTYETTTAQGCSRTEILHLTIESNHWIPVAEGTYPFSMTFYGVIQINGVEQYSDQLELGVFCGNECRGSTIASEFYLTHRYLTEVNVNGDTGQQLTFKLYDHATNQELDLTPPEAITFTIDGYGNPVNPYVLNFTSSVSITASTDPEGAGTVTGTGEYGVGSSCTLTASANTGFQFQNWTLNGTVVSTSPAYTFTVTEEANYVAHFLYLHTRPLVVGWNWWSTYIEQDGINGLEMLENSLGASGIRIQGKSTSVDYFEYQGTGYWYGALNAIANEQMYMIRTSAACNAVIVGNAALPANHPITINNGWNWIGYPNSQSVAVNAAMEGFAPEINDVIKGRNTASMYISYNGYQGWYGQLNTLEPGQGYMYKSNSDTQKTLTFQSGRTGDEAIVANITYKDNVFVPNTANYADNMIVTAVIDIDGEELRSEDYELAAFVGNECRGSVKLLYVEPYNRYMAMLMAFGDGEEELHFVLTDGNGTSWSNDRMTYVANSTVGTMTEPAVLHFEPLSIEDNIQKPVSVYPNPSNGIFNIEGKGIRKIEVIDAYGQVILSKETKNTHIQVDLSGKAAGAYLLRVVTDDGVTTHKLVKNN